ncbi:hypothetical protein D3C71_25740 [compost metagenome]
MNRQQQLLNLAQSHQDQPAVRALLTSIQEAQAAAQNSLRVLRAATGTLEQASALEDGFSVGLDNSQLAAEAAKAGAALSRMAYDFMTLAQVLQAQGASVDY